MKIIMSLNVTVEEVQIIREKTKKLYLELAKNHRVDEKDYDVIISDSRFSFIYDLMKNPNFFKKQGKEPKISLIMKFLNMTEEYAMKKITGDTFADNLQKMIVNDLSDILEKE